MATSDDKTPLKGGEFIIKDTKFNDVFTPEEWNEEQLMIAQMSRDFLAAEVYPHLDRIDSLEEGLMPSLLEKAGELPSLCPKLKPEKIFSNSLRIPKRSSPVKISSILKP